MTDFFYFDYNLSIIKIIFNKKNAYGYQLIYNFDKSNGGHTNNIADMESFDIYHATFSNSLVATCSWDNTVKIWDMTSGLLKYTFDTTNGGHDYWVTELAVLENGDLASYTYTTLKIWDIRNGRLKFTFNIT